MRAKLTTLRNPVRYEWLIVSRWGPAGGHLSVARTFLDAPAGEPPLQLTPRHTALGTLLRLPAAPLVFLLAQALPDEITVAGEFGPAEGYVRLSGADTTLRLLMEGRCAGTCETGSWRAEAVRTPWMGEFFEPRLR